MKLFTLLLTLGAANLTAASELSLLDLVASWEGVDSRNVSLAVTNCEDCQDLKVFKEDDVCLNFRLTIASPTGASAPITAEKLLCFNEVNKNVSVFEYDFNFVKILGFRPKLTSTYNAYYYQGLQDFLILLNKDEEIKELLILHREPETMIIKEELANMFFPPPYENLATLLGEITFTKTN